VGIFRGERKQRGREGERERERERSDAENYLDVGEDARGEDRRSWLYCCISAILSAVHAMPLSARRQC
jgi:hypothetical protein